VLSACQLKIYLACYCLDRNSTGQRLFASSLVLFPVHFYFKRDMSEHIEDLVRPALHQNRRCTITDAAQQRAQNLARIRDNQRMPLDDAGCMGSV
jgi:hypothetical protein